MSKQIKLERRQFMVTSGMTIGALALASCASSLGVRTPAAARHFNQKRKRRPAVAASASPILQALALGLNAPSPHNTQSWLFDIIDSKTAELRVDRSRLLPKTDPPARQIHIGCGCYIEAFLLGASTLGYAASVALWPRGRYGSQTDIGKLPVARLSLGDTGQKADPLALYIHSRQTSRLAYRGPWVDQRRFAPIQRDSRLQFSRVELIEKPQLAPYLKLFDRGMTIESKNLATNEETRHWFRFSDDEAAKRRDGLTFEANGLTGLGATFARWFTDDTQKSWNSKSTVEKGLETFRAALYSSRGLLFLATAQNDVTSQVNSGRDCYRLMLALTKHGYFCHPCNQVIQEYPQMTSLRKRFETMSGIAEPAKVQMILRIGRSEPPFVSYRRPLQACVTKNKG
jgi:hypothetical protein